MSRRTMTEAERVALFREMRSSPDPIRSEARTRLILGNIGLVVRAVRRYTGRPKDVRFREDARSVAVIALIDSVDGFDPDAGSRFAAYACTAIFRAVRLQVTRWRSPLFLSNHAAQDLCRTSVGKPAVRPQYLTAALRALDKPFRVGPVDGLEGDVNPEDGRRPTPAVESADTASFVLSQLPERHAEVLRLSLGLEGRTALSDAEIAALLGKTADDKGRLAVRSMRNHAYRTIRRKFPEVARHVA